MTFFLSFFLLQSPLSAEAVKKLQRENRDKVPAGGFIDLGKYLSILSTLLSESVAKIAPKVSVIAHILINFRSVIRTLGGGDYWT